MKTFRWSGAILVTALFMLAACLTGCEDSGGGGGGDVGDVGSNDTDVYAAVGDSITYGGNGGGAPYPPRLAAITGKTVNNYGVPGEESGSAAGAVGNILANDRPAALLILLGANDVINGVGYDTTIANLRSIIRQAKANDTVPVMATLTPMIDGHEIFGDSAQMLSALIRDLASSEDARLVDLESEFGNGEGLLLEDGLHHNEVGNQVIAEAFADAL